MSEIQCELIVSGKVNFLHVNGFLYLKKSKNGNTRYWECRRKGQCRARATTVEKDNALKVKKGKNILASQRCISKCEKFVMFSVQRLST